MKKLLFILLLFFSLASQAQLQLPYSIKIVNPRPLDFYYYASGGSAWANTAAITSAVTSAERYIGQTFYVSGSGEYWFFGGIANGNLVSKVITLPAYPTFDGKEYYLSEVDGTNAWTQTVDVNGTSAGNKTKLQAGAVSDWDSNGHYAGVTSGATSGTFGGERFYGTDAISGFKYRYEAVTNDNWYRSIVIAGSGSVTSVSGSGGTTGLTLSGGPITTSGTLTLGGTLGAANGGTGLTSYAVNDIIYASGTTTLAKLNAGTTNALLGMNNGATAPEYKTVSQGLTSGSGTLQLGGAITGSRLFTGTGLFNITNYSSIGGSMLFNPSTTLTLGFGIVNIGGTITTNTSTGNSILNLGNNTGANINASMVNNSTALSLIYAAPNITWAGFTSTLRGIYYNPAMQDAVTGSHYAAVFGSGSVGIGTITPTATLHVPTANTTAAGSAPFKLPSTGTVMTTPEPGAIETTTAHIYWTDNTGTRLQLDGGGGGGGSGTVTSASVVTANGFAGSVATATTTPAITLSTTITGLLKGNGTAISAAVSGTDIKTVAGTSIIGSGDIPVFPTQTGHANEILNTNGTAAAWSKSNRVYNVFDYGAVGDAVYIASGASGASGTSGSPTLVVSGATFTVADVGKIILISKGGSALAPLHTTILAYISSTSVTLATNILSNMSGEEIIYGHDDTAAIQAAINAAKVASGTVYFPNASYLIDGVLQTSVGGNNPNSQLYISSEADTNYASFSSITLEGESSLDLNNFFNGSATKGVLLYSTVISGISGTNPSVLATIGNSGNYNDFNYSKLVMKNIGIRVFTNNGSTVPNLSGINFLRAADISMESVSVTTEAGIFKTISPLASGRFGMWLSTTFNNGPNNFKSCYVQGFEYGAIFGEHTYVENFYALGNYNSYVFLRAGHNVYGKILSHQSVNQILIPSGTTFLGANNNSGVPLLSVYLEAEKNTLGYWFDTSTLISDTGNLATGDLQFNADSEANTKALYLGTQGVAKNLNIRPVYSSLPQQVNTAGHRVTNPGFSTMGNDVNAILEIGTDYSAGTTDGDAVLMLSSNQANTSTAPVGKIAFVNKTASGNRTLHVKGIYTEGATNTGVAYTYMNNAGSYVNTEIERATGTNYLIPITFAVGTATAGTAPVYIPTGSALLSTTQAGAIEHFGGHLYFTDTNSGTRYQLDQQSSGPTVAADGTDADFTIAINTIKYLPSATLTTNRTLTMPTGSNGDYIEIHNNESGFSWLLSGGAIYKADGVTTITQLVANTNYILRKSSGKWRIIN